MFAARKPLLPVCLALVAGSIAPLALAPLAWWPMALLSVVLWYGLLWQTTSKKHSLQIGFGYGAGYFLAGVSWIYVSMVDHA
ncbi:MAG: apolipoprotein N-acyltransferase, partial [Gammaproteobacteria bacterium]|nr:apolipoprotein N-acyltransferase [Gammaproteobacteria bacterium]